MWKAKPNTGGFDFVESMNQSSVPLESLTALDVNTFMDSISTALSIGLDANLSREILKTECNDKEVAQLSNPSLPNVTSLTKDERSEHDGSFGDDQDGHYFDITTTTCVEVDESITIEYEYSTSSDSTSSSPGNLLTYLDQLSSGYEQEQSNLNLPHPLPAEQTITTDNGNFAYNRSSNVTSSSNFSAMPSHLNNEFAWGNSLPSLDARSFSREFFTNISSSNVHGNATSWTNAHPTSYDFQNLVSFFAQ